MRAESARAPTRSRRRRARARGDPCRSRAACGGGASARIARQRAGERVAGHARRRRAARRGAPASPRRAWPRCGGRTSTRTQSRVTRIQLGEQIGRARVAGELDERLARRDDLRVRRRARSPAVIARISARHAAVSPRIDRGHRRLRRAARTASRSARSKRGELVVPAAGVTRVVRVDARARARRPPVRRPDVRPARQREPRVAEPGPRRARRPRPARTRRRRARAASSGARDRARQSHRARVACATTSSNRAAPRPRSSRAMPTPTIAELARRPRDHRRRAPRGDDRRRRDDRRRQHDERDAARERVRPRARRERSALERVAHARDRARRVQHHASSVGVATNSVHAPNASGTISSTVSPASRMIAANSSAGGNAATERWRYAYSRLPLSSAPIRGTT